MKIKGFDKNLCCRGMQFEIGKTYDTGAKDNELQLCSNTVFHYCDDLQSVHSYYSCNEDNRFCEVEVLGAEVTNGGKCGSNRIKIVREITGSELDSLKGVTNGNTGLFNTGNRNTGDGNTGNRNTGDWNTGNRNTGNRNTGDWNTGDWNTGNRNTGDGNTGDWNTGDWNTGNRNTGDGNTGDWNTGDWNTGDWNTGDGNTGNRNTGNRNTGNWNTGDWNKCDYSNGIFCSRSPKIHIFNMPSDFTLEEFRMSKYYAALTSVPFVLTEWIGYSGEEKKACPQKELTGGYLKNYTYEEACKNWWDEMTEENKKIMLSMPNFNSEIFKEITGIEVGSDAD